VFSSDKIFSDPIEKIFYKMTRLVQVLCLLVLAFAFAEAKKHHKKDKKHGCQSHKAQAKCNGEPGCWWCKSEYHSGCYGSDVAKHFSTQSYVCETDSNGKLDVVIDTIGKNKPTPLVVSQEESFPSPIATDDREDLDMVGGVFDRFKFWKKDKTEENDEPLDVQDIEDQGGLCDPDVGQVSGYFRLGEQNKHYFFWFFESRNDPENDPVVLWMTGGPGCSSGMALFVENGPCHVTDDGQKTYINNYSWNNNASIIFIDQPAGTGFSYGTHDHSEEGIGNDMYMFLTEFFSTYKQFADNKFFIAGESYGGHYVPATGHRIWLGNKQRTEDSKLPHINLSGIAIGNGLTDPLIQYKYYAEMAYKSGTAPPRVNKTTYEIMKHVSTPLCLKAIEMCNGKKHTHPACTMALQICSVGLIIPYSLSGYNQYDMSKKCEKPPLCYDFSNVETYLNKASVKQRIGVTNNKKWEACNKGVTEKMSGDYMKNYQYLIPDLLLDDIPVLVYAGDQDYICNWIGNRAWTLQLRWPGKEAFNAASEEPYMVNDQEAGRIRTSNGFTFLQIYKAGHMVPMDQPAVALQMINEFIGQA